MNLSEAANRVIDLARKVREYYSSELPKRHPNYPVVGLDEESVPPPPEEKELRDYLKTLSVDTIYQLVLIMYLGRGDFGADELTAYFKELKDTFGNPDYAASQMMGKAPLAEYLADGLEELRRHRLNVDKLPLKNGKVKKR